jgi:hypothetical protein
MPTKGDFIIDLLKTNRLSQSERERILKLSAKEYEKNHNELENVVRIIQNLDVGRHTIHVNPKPWKKILNDANLYHPILKSSAFYSISRSHLLRMQKKKSKDNSLICCNL